MDETNSRIKPEKARRKIYLRNNVKVLKAQHERLVANISEI
jgi:hypothetical protein